MSSYGHLMLNRYDVEVDNPNATPKTLTADSPLCAWSLHDSTRGNTCKQPEKYPAPCIEMSR